METAQTPDEPIVVVDPSPQPEETITPIVESDPDTSDFGLSIEEHANKLETDLKNGLTTEQCKHFLEQLGPTPNKLFEIKKISFIRVFVNEIREPMMILLLLVGVFYSIWGEFLDSIIVFIIIFLMVFVEVGNEYRAKKAVQALSLSHVQTCFVKRDGKVVEIENDQVLVGDILLLKAGQYVPADARVIESFSLTVDESTLTGDSPLHMKSTGSNNTVYAGTTVAQGRGKALVYAIGKNTEFGSVCGLLQNMETTKTPLQKSMKTIAWWLTIIAVLASVIIPLVGWLRGRILRNMFLYGLSLAFCLIPVSKKDHVRLTPLGRVTHIDQECISHWIITTFQRKCFNQEIACCRGVRLHYVHFNGQNRYSYAKPTSIIEMCRTNGSYS
jgi:magnesium-transporting ATPase (P-type)